MIVVAIIGILATLALPAYKSYMVRAQLAEINLAMVPCKRMMEELMLFKTTTARAQETDALINKCLDSVRKNPIVESVSPPAISNGGTWGGITVGLKEEVHSTLGGRSLSMTPFAKRGLDPFDPHIYNPPPPPPGMKRYKPEPFHFFSRMDVVADDASPEYKRPPHNKIAGWVCPTDSGQGKGHWIEAHFLKDFCTDVLDIKTLEF